MPDPTFPPLDISRHWRGVQADLLRVVDLVPEDRMDWTPRGDLWNFRGILIHTADARDGWLSSVVNDGEPYPNIWLTARSPGDLRRELERTFGRLERFLSDQSRLDGSYEDEWAGETKTVDGHWIAFHLLEHDIHHRAELLQRLALLGIDHGIDF